MTRRANDAYMTAPWQVRCLLHRQPIRGPILEPCAGDGAIVTTLRAQGHDVRGNDIALSRGWPTAFDASAPWPATLTPDWVITNPPYLEPTCTRIVQQAVARARVGVAMLLRLSYLQPTEHHKGPGGRGNGRGSFLADCPPDRLIVMPRYSYTGDGRHDSVTGAWVIWGKGGVCDGLPPIVCAYQAERE